jgi:hypothetical protein
LFQDWIAKIWCIPIPALVVDHNVNNNNAMMIEDTNPVRQIVFAPMNPTDELNVSLAAIAKQKDSESKLQGEIKEKERIKAQEMEARIKVYPNEILDAQDPLNKWFVFKRTI